MVNAIEIRDIAKDHAGEKALRGISLNVPEASLFGIIGADGAGKSSLMNILATLSNQDAGQAKILGIDLATKFKKIRSDLGYMPQRFSLYQDLSVLENMNFFADIFGIFGKEKSDRMAHLLDFAGLKQFKARRAGLLSGGMKQKLALACTLIHQPKILLLDEPTVGVDPVARRDFWTMLQSLRAQGITMVVSTPYMDEAALCDQLILLHEGSILAQGTPTQLLKDYPYRLFRVEAGEPSTAGRPGHSTLTYPGDRPPPPGFELIYPSGGSLHAAEAQTPLTRKGLSLVEALTSIRTVVPEAAAVSVIEPTLEDFFFALLLGHKTGRET